MIFFVVVCFIRHTHTHTQVCEAMDQKLFRSVVCLALGSILNALLSVHLLAALQAAYSKYETDQSTATWHKVKSTATAAMRVPRVLCQCCQRRLPKNRAIERLRPQLEVCLERELQMPVLDEGSWSEVKVVLRREFSLGELRRARTDSDARLLLAEKVSCELNDPEQSMVARNNQLGEAKTMRSRISSSMASLHVHMPKLKLTIPHLPHRHHHPAHGHGHGHAAANRNAHVYSPPPAQQAQQNGFGGA